MRTDPELARVVRSWLREDRHEDADRVLGLALDQLDTTPQRRATWLGWRSRFMGNTVRIALAAAAAVVVALLGYQALLAPDVGGPRPSGSPSPSATVVDFADHPDGSRLAAGSYVFSHVTPLRVTFTVPDGWEKGALDWVVWSVEGNKARMAVMVVDNLYADPCHPELGLSDPAVGPSVDDLATALGNVPGLTFSEPTDVSLGGFAGTYMEYVPPSTFADCAEEIVLWSVNDGTATPPAPAEEDETFGVWILDVRGTRLVISTSSSSAVPPLRVTQLESIVDSIRIE